MAETAPLIKVSPHACVTGVVYLSYYVTALGGLLLTSRNLPAGLCASGIAPALYSAVTILLCRHFHPAQPLLSFTATLCSPAGCVNDELHQLHFGLGGHSSLLFFGAVLRAAGDADGAIAASAALAGLATDRSRTGMACLPHSSDCAAGESSDHCGPIPGRVCAHALAAAAWRGRGSLAGATTFGVTYPQERFTLRIRRVCTTSNRTV